MSIPRFHAEASLYKSEQLYHASRGANQTPVIVAAFDCTDACASAYAICLVTTIFDPLQGAACFPLYEICLSQCPPPSGPTGGGGGGTPPPPPVCGGTRCRQGQICCLCPPAVEPDTCMSPGLCERLCRLHGGLLQ